MLISPECLKSMLNQGYGKRSIHGGSLGGGVPGYLVSLLNNFYWSCNDKAFHVPPAVLAKELAKTYQYLIDNGEEVVVKKLGRLEGGLIVSYLRNFKLREYYSNFKVSKLDDV